MAEIKSESVADFVPESTADFVRNTQGDGMGYFPEMRTAEATDAGKIEADG
jgi:hypothetical protein